MDDNPEYKIQLHFDVPGTRIEVWREMGVGWRRVYAVKADRLVLESHYADLILIVKLVGEERHKDFWDGVLDRASILASVPKWESILT
jgi:hypothetical protein